MDRMSRDLLSRTALFVVALAAMIFLPAWSLRYWQGLVYWLLFSACTVAAGVYFLKRDPALVRRRMRTGVTAETEPAQKVILAFASVFLVATYIVSALDHRLRGPAVPPLVVILANACVVLGYVVVGLTLRANTFAASTVTVEAGQTVVSSGPYAIVRHPMYSGGILMFLATPLALDSWRGLVPAALMSAAIVARLIHEERVMERGLPDYAAYRRKVRYRLLPLIW